jgi:hypothetical protein
VLPRSLSMSYVCNQCNQTLGGGPFFIFFFFSSSSPPPDFFWLQLQKRLHKNGEDDDLWSRQNTRSSPVTSATADLRFRFIANFKSWVIGDDSVTAMSNHKKTYSQGRAPPHEIQVRR